MQHKSLCAFDLKADDSRPGLVTGRASVYGVTDSYLDIVMPGAFTRTLQEKGGRIVVLSQHDPSASIGLATLTDKPDGLHCSIQLELEIAQARDDYARVKSGLVSGISIGYETIRDEVRKDGARLLREVSLWEISLVTFPANSQARVTTVKRTAGVDALAQLKALTAEIQQARVLVASRSFTATISAATRDIKQILGRR